MLFPLILALTAISDDGREVTPSEQERVKSHFDQQLFDGFTARWQFDNVRADFLVCGKVNAKNRLGSYAGWAPFYFNLNDETGRIFSHDEDPWLYKVLCLGADPETA